jgi:hypothetical protein
MAPMRAAHANEPPAKPVDLRWVPKALLASMGVVAVALLGILGALQFAPPARQEPLASAQFEETAGPTPLEADDSRYELLPEEPLPRAPDSESAPQPVAAAEAEVAPAAVVPIAVPAAVPNVEASPPRPQRAAPAPIPSLAELRRAARQQLLGRRPATPAPPVPTSGAEPASEAHVARAQEREPAGSMEVPTAAPAPRVDASVANLMLGRFSQAYGDGDINGMRQLFVADVRSSRGGLREILADYQDLFGRTNQRSLQVRNVSWFADGDTLTVIASYNATVFEGPGPWRRARKSTGDLRFDLRKVNDQWRIYRFQHGERPG